MKKGNKYCTTCWHSPIKKKQRVHSCPEGVTPVTRRELPVGTTGIISSMKGEEHFLACTHSSCERGQHLISSALQMARGELEVHPDMKKNKDGSIEFINEGKRRRVYPDGTLRSKRGTKWINMGEILENPRMKKS